MVDSEQQERKKRIQKSAKTAVMDMLARRDHSPREIQTKLRHKYTNEEVNEAIEWVKSNGWLASDTDLSEKFSHHLHQRKKGIHYINAKLTERGLPSINEDPDLELQKAIELVENKKAFKDNWTELFAKGNPSREDIEKLKAKIGRFLVSRGFAMNIVRKVVYEYLNKLDNK